jgi:hypothetical protein
VTEDSVSLTAVFSLDSIIVAEFLVTADRHPAVRAANVVESHLKKG